MKHFNTQESKHYTVVNTFWHLDILIIEEILQKGHQNGSKYPESK